jgi:MFS family permease
MTIEPANSRSTKYIRAITIGLGAFIATFDVTAVSLALPAISETFSLDVAGYVWVMDAYSLAFAITLITAGAVADRYGQKLTLVAGAVVFLVASALCAYATHFSTFLTGRVVQGASAAFIICGGVAMAGRLYKEKTERVQAFGIIGTISGSALAIGPALGGLIASTFGWTWIFLMNVPICVAIISVALGWMDEYRSSNAARMDVAGVVVVSALLLISIWSLLHGPTVGGVVFSSAAAGISIASLLILFVWIETKARYPAVDIHLFKKREFVGLAIVPLSLSVSYWSLIVFMPFFLESSLQIGGQRASYVMLFFTLPMFVVPLLLANPAIARMAAGMRQSSYYFTGLFVVALGCGAVAVGSYLHEYVLAIAGMIVAGVGAAAMQSQVSGALIACAPQERAGNVTAVATVLRQGGFAIATAFLAKVMQAKIYLGPYSIESFTLLFSVCGLVAGIGAVCTLVLTQTRADFATAALEPSK